MIEGLTSQAFFDTFTRFTDRQGLCTNLYSDNGTGFVGNGLFSALPGNRLTLAMASALASGILTALARRVFGVTTVPQEMAKTTPRPAGERSRFDQGGQLTTHALAQ